MKRQGIATWMARAAVALMLLGLATVQRARAQETSEQGAGRQRFAGMQRVGGQVTAVSGANVTIKAEDGATYQVVTTDNTRVMRGRGVALKVSELKPGDGVMAMGNLDAPNKTMHAAVVMSVDAEQMKKMEEVRKQNMANLGKTLIAGRVTAVDLDKVTMTVERPDGVTQTIAFDEGTSFRRGRFGTGGVDMGMTAGAGMTPARGGDAGTGESITLADVKAGDRVVGPGGVKNGRFVPQQLTVVSPGGGRRRGSEQPGAGAGATTPGGTQPESTAPR
ncbi:MAG TPA: hypothetical protein VM865_03320 [Acidobacteriaceae bacterium]|jgi:hypothetical protein|nr:hypothetical protein [Acidobacteriaceae bacterium]